jgi:hypothetical protein
MNDTDIYDGRHRSPDPPPDAAADTGSKYATGRGIVPETPLQRGGEMA